MELISDVIKKNLFQIVLIAIGITIAFTVLQQELKTLAYQVQAQQKVLDKYPSEDYFDLKFKTIDDKLQVLTDDLREHKDATGR